MSANLRNLDLPLASSPPWHQPVGAWRQRGACLACVRIGLGLPVTHPPAATQQDGVGYTPWHYWAQSPRPADSFPLILDMLESSQRDTLAHQGEHPWYRLLLHGQHVALKQWVERWGCPQQATDSAPETSTWFHAAAWSACPVTLAFAAKLELPNINAQDANGLTPLIIGIHRGDEAFVDALIRAGADPMMADQQGRTAMHHAAQYGDVDILSHLEDAGGVVESEDEYGLAANELAKARRHSNPKERATLRQHWERRYQQLLSF